ncbi:carboxypeptidase-like regulatory domain-containing protein [Microvirga sp. STR05]|uniref:Carboxypeptidase-like regulatory domain-containing protein n=1 Tax=Hymenobacter duratus TaxID=2771356 RepID=A0ABR8JM84_9BACT|nr:carboxypeptidase-like regulatory domain-containing protein [Hymenobacter duratus]MBD2717005.1 carboxypeptidase-like regulatory domain-containing protein [Hymenobacter duratus]MBR7951921.1 carboxypeptidase-like regulatory domain-containing protein [Microvirga sp. STR05]
MPSKYTLPEPETDEAGALLSEEDSLSSGNGRLAIIVGAILLLAIVGYMFMPGSGGRRVITNVMPSVMLGEASVTGTRPAAEPAAATAVAAETEDAATKPATDKTKKAVTRTTIDGNLATRTTESVGTTEATPVSEAAAPAAAPEAAAAPANVTLSGRILDENGRPLAGATVLVKGSRKGTGTDANGNYSIEVPAGENALVYGYGGYQDQEVRTRGSQPVNVTLLPSENGKRRRR